MENWNPNTSRRPVLSGIPIAVPDQKTVDRMTSLYYLMIGSLATITQTAIKDLYDELYQRKDLFKSSSLNLESKKLSLVRISSL